ncbi:hypothetical protein MMC30_000876 [Trapelia coarctata]|nr:hypothetical protein [Trapelia coarctata]
MATPLSGAPLIAAITSVCSAGFLLFGYDQGVMSGIVLSAPFLAQMSHPSTLLLATLTALYPIGACAGALLAAVVTEVLGRKRSLILGAGVLTAGSAMMGAAGERVLFMVARVVTGVGVGFITSVTPVYASESGAAAQRGWQVCCQLSTMLVGLMLAYWINYGMYFREGGVQWRFPLLFQCVFSVYILVLTPFLPDTPRWLMRHGDVDGGVRILARLRGKGVDDVDVQREKEEIVMAIGVEGEAKGGWGDLLRGDGVESCKRFYLAVGIQFMQQMSGNELNFPQWWMIDRVGRRKLFLSMAIGMSLVLIGEAVCVALGGYSASIAAVFFVFMFEACFTWGTSLPHLPIIIALSETFENVGWMATVWIYPAEILPLKIRAKGAALAAAADFLGNFLVVEITPPALANIGYRTYILFAVFNIANAIIVWCFYPETAGQTLESIDRLFAKEDDGWLGDERDRWYRRLQWNMVGRAERARNLRRRTERQRRRRSADSTGVREEDGVGEGDGSEG